MGANKNILVTADSPYRIQYRCFISGNGYRVIIVDDLSNSKLDVMDDIWS